jgi:hypothetical protein
LIYLFIAKVIFILSELESVLLFQQTLTLNFTLTNWTTLFGSITFDSTQQRSFTYSFIGRQCNGSWTILKTINSAFTSVDIVSDTCFNYPSPDISTAENNGKLILMNNKTNFLFNY